VAKTVIEKHDTGEWTNLHELKEYIAYSFESLKSIVENKRITTGKLRLPQMNLAQKQSRSFSQNSFTYGLSRWANGDRQ